MKARCHKLLGRHLTAHLIAHLTLIRLARVLVELGQPHQALQHLDMAVEVHAYLWTHHVSLVLFSLW